MSKLFQKFKQDIVGLFFLSLAVFIGVALFSYNPSDPSFNSIGKNLQSANYCGYIGSFIADILYQLVGFPAWMIVFGLLRTSLTEFTGAGKGLRNLRLLWATTLLVTLCALLASYFPQVKIFQKQIMVGGLLGSMVSQVFVRGLNPVGAQIVLWTSALILTIFFSEKTISELVKNGLQLLKKLNKHKLIKINKKSSYDKAIKMQLHKNAEQESPPPQPAPVFSLQAEDEPEPEKESLVVGDEPIKRRKVVLKTQVQRRVENWELPKLNLLEDPPASRVKIDEREIKRKAEILKEKLANFEVTGDVVAARPGPAVTLFEFRPDANVKVSEITALEDDLSLALSSESLRILAPIPGRDVVGIETSNAHRETVYFKDMLADEEFWKDDMKLPIALGKTSTGESKIMDLRKLPHLMVAGTTGSGKSVFTVSLITGLLFKHSPKTLRLIIVDPKQVDYAAFEKVPHLAMPVIGDTRQAVIALKWAVNEMEKRYRSMNRFGARGIEAYNETVAKLTKEQIDEHEKIIQELDTTPGKRGEKYYYQPLPYFVVVLEEFGDLMTVDKQNVETSVVRLAQKARACGMHLVLALQSPRKEVVTGLIKTNIPGRIAFKVNAGMDSRIILDETGAERLLAQGDMLYKSPGSSALVRHHGPFLKDGEVIDVAKYWAQQAEPEFDSSAMQAIEGNIEGSVTEDINGDFANGDYDDKYDEILAWVAAQKAVSASLIQRRFAIGYPRAARIVETFEREGVVGPANGSKPRVVMVNNLA